jgi:mannitol-specific phosphotransferase system IIBC component
LTRQLYLDDHVHELTATRKYPEQQKSEQQLGKTKKKKKKKEEKILKSKKHCFFCLAGFIQPSAIQKSILQERKSYF